MLKIDGSIGEGGGQIVRTAVALAAVTKNNVEIKNIRANRNVPGLRPQHLKGIQALEKITRGKLEGGRIGSTKVRFFPKDKEVNKENKDKLKIDIGTAGSITLALQTILPVILFSQKRFEIELKGGTDVRWSPPLDYIRYVKVPLLNKFGANIKIGLLKRGYYPKGGGKVKINIKSKFLRPIELLKRGKILSIEGISHAHYNLQKRRVAERQIKGLEKGFDDFFSKDKIKIKKDYWDTLSIGSGITVWAVTENSFLGGSALGKKGKKSENVGKEAAQDLKDSLENKNVIDKYMSDQIIPYIALQGGKCILNELSSHAQTNLQIVKKFGFEIKRDGKIIECEGLTELHK